MGLLIISLTFLVILYLMLEFNFISNNKHYAKVIKKMQEENCESIKEIEILINDLEKTYVKSSSDLQLSDMLNHYESIVQKEKFEIMDEFLRKQTIHTLSISFSGDIFSLKEKNKSASQQSFRIVGTHTIEEIPVQHEFILNKPQYTYRELTAKDSKYCYQQ